MVDSSVIVCCLGDWLIRLSTLDMDSYRKVLILHNYVMIKVLLSLDLRLLQSEIWVTRGIEIDRFCYFEFVLLTWK